MNRKILFVTGAILVFGAVLAAATVVQNTTSEKAGSKGHECTPEMMENMGYKNGSAAAMAQNCDPETMNSGMMNSGSCENMTGNASAGCSSMNNMMNNQTKNHMTDPNHCSGSMMGNMMSAHKIKGSMM